MEQLYRQSSTDAMRKIILFLWVLIFSCPLPVRAADEVSEQAESELVTQTELFRKKPEPVPVREEKKPEIEEEEKKTETTGEKGPTFLVQTITLEGNRIFSAEELHVYTEPVEGREISFGELRKVAESITNHYRSRGYTTSRAFIPPQKVENAVPVIRIVEGRTGQIVVEGNRFFNKRLYEKMLKRREDQVFHYQDLETSLYFLNQLPDRKAKAYLIAGEEPETSDIILKADEKNPVHASYEFSNRGTKFTHRARHTLNLTDNNFLGQGDTLNLSLAGAEEGAFQGASTQYSFPIQETGTVLQMSMSLARSMLVKHLKTLEVEGNSIAIVPAVLQHVYRTPRLTIDGYLGFEIKDSKTDLGARKLSFDRVRVLKAGPRAVRNDRWGRTILSGDVHWGVPGILGANEKRDPQASRAGSGGEFVYYTGTAARVQRLPQSSILIIRTTGQFPKVTLPSIEQFRAGGEFSVRGYPEGDAAGDYGYNWSAELRVPPVFMPKDARIPWAKKKWREAIYFVAFVDGAKTYLRQRATPATVKDKLLLGTGFGLRVDLDEMLQLYLDAGYPFGDDSTDKDRAQIHLAVRTGF